MNVGEKFRFKGYEWVALEVNEDNVVPIMTKAWDTAAFDEDNRNDWKTSSARKSLQEELLPSSYNQKRTVTMNYENAATIIRQRTGHKLDEWHEIVRVLTDLPYMDDIINGNEGEG